MFELLAQEAGKVPEISGWVGLAGTLTTSGILTWFLWYRTSVADPAREKALAEERTKEREAFIAELKKEREDFRAELKTIRDRGDILAAKGFDSLDKFCTSMDGLAAKVERLETRCSTHS